MIARLKRAIRAYIDPFAGWDEYVARRDYYGVYDWNRYCEAGRPPLQPAGPNDTGYPTTPMPTEAQWASLSPEQKADRERPVLF